MRHTFRVDSEIDRQPKLSLEVIDRVIFHDWRGDLPDDHRLVSYFSSDRRVERKEQPSSLTRDGIAVINALFCIGLADAVRAATTCAMYARSLDSAPLRKSDFQSRRTQLGLEGCSR
jgi:hypothetical protein